MPMDVQRLLVSQDVAITIHRRPRFAKILQYTFGEYQTWTQHVKLWSCRWLASYFDKFTRHEPEGTGMYFYICPYMFCFRCLYRITLKMQNGSQLIGLLNRVSQIMTWTIASWRRWIRLEITKNEVLWSSSYFDEGPIIYIYIYMILSWALGNLFAKRSLEVKLPTIWTDGKAEVGRVRERRAEERRSEKRKGEEKEDAGARKVAVREKVAKSRNIVFLQWFVAQQGRKVGSLKQRVRSHFVRWEMENCTPLWREAHFNVKMHKTSQLRSSSRSWDVKKLHAVVARSTFRSQNVQSTRCSDQKCGSLDVEKVHAVVARSTCPSQNVQNTSAPDHFCKLRCWSTVVARSTFRSPNVKNTTCSDHFWTFRCRFSWQVEGIGHLVKSEQNVRVL